MFSSLASYLFGTNSDQNPENPSVEQQQQQRNEQEQQQREQQQQQQGLAGDVIEVTSRTPSVTGGNRRNGGPGGSCGKRAGGKNRRGFAKQSKGNPVLPRKSPPTITKLLTPNTKDDDFDEDEWFIVEKEEEGGSLPRTDSEEDIAVVEVQQPVGAAASSSPSTSVAGLSTSSGSAARRRQNINSHSLYSGPRPQQQRNQRGRNNSRYPLSVSSFEPPVSDFGPGFSFEDDCLSQPLFASSPAISPCNSDHEDAANNSGCSDHEGAANTSACSDENAANLSGFSYKGANKSMDESWYVTPPPCFTSIGPINMETSPFENLLIEHPSMSVYHSIRSAQEATESFVNLDLGVNNNNNNNEPQPQPQQEQQPLQEQQEMEALQEELEPMPELEMEQENPPEPIGNEQEQPVQPRPGANAARIDNQTAIQLKQEVLTRNSQKSKAKKEYKSLCRGAMKRSNKVRDFQSKSNRPRRSDMQHCKLISGANNNRNCRF